MSFVTTLMEADRSTQFVLPPLLFLDRRGLTLPHASMYSISAPCYKALPGPLPQLVELPLSRLLTDMLVCAHRVTLSPLLGQQSNTRVPGLILFWVVGRSYGLPM